MEEEDYIGLVDQAKVGDPLPPDDLAALDAEARRRVDDVYAQIAESD
jgi:hypothetical protein